MMLYAQAFVLTAFAGGTYQPSERAILAQRVNVVSCEFLLLTPWRRSDRAFLCHVPNSGNDHRTQLQTKPSRCAFAFQ
eukprot:3473571-Pleurochrysis_carterae.AAC.4